MVDLKKSKGECEVCGAEDVDLVTFGDAIWYCNYCWTSYETRRPLDPASWRSIALAINTLEKRLTKKGKNSD